MDIWSFLEKSFEDNKNLTALECSHDHGTYTYEDVRRGSSDWAWFISSFSVDSRPPPVVFLCLNSIESAVVVLGALRGGSLVHMMCYNLPIDTLTEMVEQSEANIIITDVTGSDIVDKVVANVNRKFHIFTTGINVSDEASCERIIEEANIERNFPNKKIDQDSPAFVFFSSGTTGAPKGIILSHKSVISNVKLFHQDFESVTSANQSVHLVIGTFAHLLTYLLYLANMRAGGKAVLVRGLDDNRVLSAAQKYEPVTLYARSSLLNSFSKLENLMEYLGSVRLIVNVGSVITSTVFLKLRGRTGEDVILKNIYGCTESGVLGTSVDPSNPCLLDLSANTEIRIIDPKTKEDLPPNQLGEICSRSPGMMISYFKNPTATNEVLDHDGWMHTGDSGYMTENNQLFYFERIKDLLHIHGKLISPVDIENVFFRHPGVKDAGVGGLPDVEGGELPMAFVVKDESKQVSEDELLEFANERIAIPEHKVKMVVFQKSIPRNHMGKIERKLLREMVWKF